MADFSGTALARRGDREIASLAEGRASAGTDARASTRYQIASISKQFTAAAILALADQGSLSVKDPMQRWLKGCPAHWEGITVHHLLSHTSGIGHWPDVPDLDTTRDIGEEELLDKFKDAPMVSVPGSAYAYSSPGYVLLAHIVQQCSDSAYPDFLERTIFGPLGMASSFAGSGLSRSDLATGMRDGVPVASFNLDVTGMGAGDVWSTVGDLDTWSLALSRGRILSDDARHAMLSTQAPIASSHHFVAVDGYGYGTYLASVDGRRLIFHTGDNWGFQSFNGYFPDDDVRIAVLTNDEDVDLEPVFFSLYTEAIKQS